MYFLWGRRGGGWEGHLWSLAMYFVQVLKDASLPSLCKDHVRFVIPFLGFSSCISFSCRDFVFLPGVLWIRWDCGPAWKTFRWDCGPALNTFIFIYLVCYTYLSSGSTNFVDHIYCPFRSECPCVPCLCPSLFPLIYFLWGNLFVFFFLYLLNFCDSFSARFCLSGLSTRPLLVTKLHCQARVAPEIVWSGVQHAVAFFRLLFLCRPGMRTSTYF